MNDVRRLLGENFRFAGTALVSHKLRATLTIVGIVIGVWAVIGMVAVVTGFQRSTEESFSSLGTTLVAFQKFEPSMGVKHVTEAQRMRKDLTLADAEALEALCPSMRAVSPERYLAEDATVRSEGKEGNSPTIAGGTQSYAECNNWTIGDGRNITETDVMHGTDVAVVGADVVRSLFEGKEPLGRSLTINGKRYRVVGVFDRKGSSAFSGDRDNIVLIPISTFDRHYPQVRNSHGDTLRIATLPRDSSLVDRVVEEGTNILRARRKVPFDKPNDFAVWTSSKLIENMRSVTSAISGVMVLIAGIALVVGGVGVMNIMLVTVTERTREIGVRKAIGAQRRDITLQFLVESTTLTGIGGLLGVGLALVTASVIRAISPLRASTPLWSIVLGVVVSMSIGLFFGLYPAMRAAKLDPIEALRYE